MKSSDLLLVLMSGLVVLHGLFCVIYLLTFPRSKGFSSHRILAAVIFFLSLRVGKSLWLSFADDIPLKVIFVGLSCMLAIGPLFLLYTFKLIDGNEWRPRDSIHFIPFVLFFLFGISMEETFLKSLPTAVVLLFFVIFYSHYLGYVIYGMYYARLSKHESMSTQKKEWLRLIGIALICSWLVYVLNLFEEELPYVLGPIMYSVIVYTTTFIAIKNSYLSSITHQKYKSTPLADLEILSLYQSIFDFLTTHEAYTNPDLTLDKLSEAVHATPQKVSMVINHQSGKNFNQFINGFRVEASKKLLKSSKHAHFTIAAIGMEAGFNSVNTFNQAFKKETGITPSEFRKRQD
jgi:AraC-like DNA-binding protein